MASKQDVVVVTINHRLNVLGYLYLGDLGGGEFADASSAGMLDCVLALQWVKDNIERFGGDPSRVLIFGESGGGRKTSTMMVMPPAQGLFHRCVVQSGSQLTLDTPEVGMERTEKFLKALNIARTDIGKLQDASLDQLLGAVAGAVEGTGQFRPVAGAPSTPWHPFHPDAPAISAGVPMMIGSNRTEQSVFMGGNADIVTLDDAGLNQRLASWIPESDRADVVAMYRRLYPEVRNDELLYMASTDRGYFLDSTIQAALKAEQGAAPAFHYQFYRETPVEGGRYHVPHASEIPFVFDNLDKAISIGGQPTLEAQALADRMSATWATFARTGDPNHEGLPTWPAYDTRSRPSMIFDVETRVENDPRSAQRQRMLAFGSQQHQGREAGPG
jgi:para-nitrobenzyl esterase